MRYSKIHKLDVSNGSGIGVALFVQGCHFHCKNCFNKETWNFDKGKEWTPEIENEFLNLIIVNDINIFYLLFRYPLVK